MDNKMHYIYEFSLYLINLSKNTLVRIIKHNFKFWTENYNDLGLERKFKRKNNLHPKKTTKNNLSFCKLLSIQLGSLYLHSTLGENRWFDREIRTIFTFCFFNGWRMLNSLVPQPSILADLMHLLTSSFH